MAVGSPCRKVPSQLMLDPTSFTLPTRRDVNMLLQCTNLCRQFDMLNIGSLSPLLALDAAVLGEVQVSGSCVAWMSPLYRWERSGTNGSRLFFKVQGPPCDS